MITLFPHWDVEENVCLTEFKQLIDNLIENIPNLKYSIWQFELSPSTNKIHLQIYVELAKSVRLSKIIKLFTFTGFRHPHCEARIHSRTACRNYCKKSDSRLPDTAYSEIGEWREDSKVPTGALESIVELIQHGRDEFWIAYNRPMLYLRYGDKISKLLQLRKIYSMKLERKNTEKFLSEQQNNSEEE